MPYEVKLLEVAPQQVAAVKVNTSLSRIGEDIAAGFGTVAQAVAGSGVSPSGAPLIVYHDLIDEETDGDIEICIPVDGSIEAESDVYGRELQGGMMASTIHSGPYPDIGPAYQTVTSWIAEHGHGIAGPPREISLNDPQTVPEEELLTRVDFPIYADR